jgi:CDGSH-type Zn-finger protein
MSDEHPIMLDLEPDTYYWCSCGKTKNSPFCDGSHEGTNFLPVEFEITKNFATAIAPQMHPIVMARMKNFNYFRNANGLKYSSHLHHNFALKREVYDDKKIT